MAVCYCVVGTPGKQHTTSTRVVEQDSPLTSKHLETTLLSDAFVEPSLEGTAYTSQSLFFIDVV